MKYHLVIAAALSTIGCTSMQSRETGQQKVQRICRMVDAPNSREIICEAKSKDSKTRIAFRMPKRNVVFTENITNYLQETRDTAGGGWSGGGFAGGFVIINHETTPKTLEIHALERSPCTCRHLQAYFGNGTYEIQP